MNSPLLNEPGAVAADGPDAGVAAHYGDPYAEQRGTAAGWGVVDRSGRGVVRVTGADRLSWLHNLTSQHTEQLAPGTGTQSLVLSPQGHVEHHLTLTDDGTATWIHVEPGQAGPLLEFLTSMRFMLRVEPHDVTGSYAVLTLPGPAVPAGLAASGVRIDTGAGTDWPVTDLLVPRAELAGAVAALRAQGATLAGMWAHEALRIAAGQARPGTDTDHKTIPHEVGWIETAVHLGKGCYRGQETVARVHNLGHPPRRLVLLQLDGSADKLPAPGDQVLLAGAPGDPAVVGFAGSAARHYEQGPVALALVRRTTPLSAPLTVAGVAAAQEEVVSPDAGANVRIDPGLRRRGDLTGRAR